MVGHLALVIAACGSTAPEHAVEPPAPSREARVGSFGDDVGFLERHSDLVVLARGESKIAVAPAYQGRVMTSTSAGDGGRSYGFIHRPVIESGERQPHITVVGGEDRFWLGPEAGQYALYFEPDAPFDLAHWQVPEPIDWGAWDVVSRSEHEIALRRDMSLTSRFGTRFDLRVDRVVRILDASEALRELGVATEGLRAVVYETDNTITNTGAARWRRETGLLSIWILGMFVPSPATTVAVPIVPGSESERGPAVNDRYFGAVPEDRIEITDRAVFLRGDGQHRCKIGVARPRALPFLGSWDSTAGLLTIVSYTLPPGEDTEYVSSMWEIQDEPYRGDVVNSYNDGPPEPGARPLGPFYELETSSPAAALAPNASLTHRHRTIHAEGSREALDALATRTLGVGLADIDNALR
jgi:hypothetical protein